MKLNNTDKITILLYTAGAIITLGSKIASLVIDKKVKELTTEKR